MRSTKFKNDLEVIFFEVFLLKMFVACLWPTHTILSQLGKRKKPLYKGFCILLVSKILTFRELWSTTSCFKTVLKFFDCHFPLIFWAFLPFRFSVVLFLNHKNRCFLLLRFKLQSLKNVSHNTIILKQSNSKTLFPSIF